MDLFNSLSILADYIQERKELTERKSTITLSTNKDSITMRNWRKNNPEKARKLRLQEQERTKKQRLSLMDILGGRKCVDCGYDADVRALHIDHIGGGGCEDRKLFKGNINMYRYYLKIPTIAVIKLQVLCMNCNTIKQHNHKEWKGKC